MRYIRTKDGQIIDKERVVDNTKIFHMEESQIERINYPSGWYWFTEEYGYELECKDEEIIVESDKIDDLFDAFAHEVEVTGVVMQEWFADVNTFRKHWMERHERYSGCGVVDFYGAIRIKGEGLIYKAKLKGILPNGEIDWELL